jgi:flagellar biosynthesis anti-sigma factor FlgM
MCAVGRHIKVCQESADKEAEGSVRIMRVDLTHYGTESVDSGKQDRARVAPTPAEPGNETAVSDQTHFSFDQTRVKLLQTQALAQPEVRQQRVDLLRQSLGKGEYAVSDNKLADAIIADLTNGSGTQPTG